MRTAYFCLAALWGFVIGAGGLAFALANRGTAVQPGLPGAAILLCFALVAGVGGVVSATAYREARRRRR